MVSHHQHNCQRTPSVQNIEALLHGSLPCCFFSFSMVISSQNYTLNRNISSPNFTMFIVPYHVSFILKSVLFYAHFIPQIPSCVKALGAAIAPKGNTPKGRRTVFGTAESVCRGAQCATSNPANLPAEAGDPCLPLPSPCGFAEHASKN